MFLSSRYAHAAGVAEPALPSVEFVWVLGAFAQVTSNHASRSLFCTWKKHCGLPRTQRDGSVGEGKLIVFLLRSRCLDVSV